jgi:drug/metabolite transporter (DMT)-like permease
MPIDYYCNFLLIEIAAILLQKLQPLFVFILARIFLKEKIKPSFYFYALLAIFGALLLSLPSFNLKDLTSIELKSKGIFFALSAAFLWAIATVVGKSVLHRLPALIVTYWRFVFGLITLAGLMLAAHISFPTETLRQPQVIRSLFYMGLFPGLIAMTLYYFGMKKISAHLTTVMELVFPISAIIINTYVLHLPLTTIQMVGAAILIFSVTITTLQHR